ncbi:SDR family oxidoreductase [Paenisporosarcina cavernae]|uniref:NAD-dependent epimerase/dehydratase family protein n=1 Tax=Paenisporosarcina cavernae TaxID=2320858 RepID=A0A385YRD8_9BACL|nr:SDR family oxidoreductase [Paenisporosarcina cavernae]AYC29051.1 NAD-dependent epimerase/dehydratase family protein [Paenisporosarcina cavernae]
MQTPFMTGFPGFITTQLIHELIRQKKATTFYLLVLENQMSLARETISKMELPESVHLHLIEGDITQFQMGLTDEDLGLVKEEVDVVWHLAAIYDLAVPKNIAWKVNVHGTASVLETIQHFPHLKRLMYFSTAYVAGTRTGLLKETELIRPKSFKNYYEETKFEAELMLKEEYANIPATVIRPGIVRGHSKTGTTIKFDGPYFFLNMIERLKGLPVIPYVGKSSSYINVVPIDYIMEAAVYLSELEAANHQTVHLTDPNPHPVEEVYRRMVQLVTGKSPKGRFPLALAKSGLGVKKVRQMLGVEQETLDYLTWDAQFDTTVAEKLLQDSEITCADFIDSMEPMVQFYVKNKDHKKYHVKIE